LLTPSQVPLFSFLIFSSSPSSPLLLRLAVVLTPLATPASRQAYCFTPLQLRICGPLISSQHPKSHTLTLRVSSSFPFLVGPPLALLPHHSLSTSQSHPQREEAHLGIATSNTATLIDCLLPLLPTFNSITWESNASEPETSILALPTGNNGDGDCNCSASSRRDREAEPSESTRFGHTALQETETDPEYCFRVWRRLSTHHTRHPSGNQSVRRIPHSHPLPPSPCHIPYRVLTSDAVANARSYLRSLSRRSPRPPSLRCDIGHRSYT